MPLSNWIFSGLIVCTAFFGVGCWGKNSQELTQIEEYLIETEAAIAQLVDYQQQLETAVDESAQKLEVAITNSNLRVDDQLVKDFINKWSGVNSNRKKFRESFEITIEKADFLFAYAEYENSLIKDKLINEDLNEIIQTKNKQSFETLIPAFNRNFKDCIDSDLREANHIIKAFDLDVINLLEDIEKYLERLKVIHERLENNCLIMSNKLITELELTLGNEFPRVKQ